MSDLPPGTRVVIDMTPCLWPQWDRTVTGTLVGPSTVDGYSVVALDEPHEHTYERGPKKGQTYRITELRAPNELIRALEEPPDGDQ